MGRGWPQPVTVSVIPTRRLDGVPVWSLLPRHTRLLSDGALLRESSCTPRCAAPCPFPAFSLIAFISETDFFILFLKVAFLSIMLKNCGLFREWSGQLEDTLLPSN